MHNTSTMILLFRFSQQRLQIFIIARDEWYYGINIASQQAWF